MLFTISTKFGKPSEIFVMGGLVSTLNDHAAVAGLWLVESSLTDKETVCNPSLSGVEGVCETTLAVTVEDDVTLTESISRITLFTLIPEESL